MLRVVFGIFIPDTFPPVSRLAPSWSWHNIPEGDVHRGRATEHRIASASKEQRRGQECMDRSKTEGTNTGDKHRDFKVNATSTHKKG